MHAFRLPSTCNLDLYFAKLSMNKIANNRNALGAWQNINEGGAIKNKNIFINKQILLLPLSSLLTMIKHYVHLERVLFVHLLTIRKKPSLRKAARKFKCSQITIRNILRKMQKKKLCIKKERKSNITHVQRLVARPKSKRLLQVYRNFDVHTGNDSYYSNEKNLRPYDVN